MSPAPDILAVVVPVFLISGAGWLWVRLGRPFDSLFVTEVVTHVGAPCLIFSTLTRQNLDPQALAESALASAICFLAFAVIGALFLKATRLSLRAFLPTLLFPNTGNMGLPLCLFAFGERGLGLAIVYFTIASTLQFTAGPAIAMGTFAPGRLLRLPVLYAVAIALLFIALRLPVPGWLANTTGLLGSLAVPLMLMALGVALGQLRLHSAPRALMLAVARLAMGIAVGWGVGVAMDLDAVGRGVLIIQSAMPVAVFNYLFAQKYDVAPAEVASAVLMSTALSFLSLPLLLALVL